MSKKISLFSKNLLSLKIQLETLFEDVGGAETIDLLDSLSNLGENERAIALRMMTAICQKLAATPSSLTTAEKKMKELEDLLVNDISQEIASKFGNKLSLVHGGKKSELDKDNKKTQNISPKILEFKPVLN
jgi:hypothetical protein